VVDGERHLVGEVFGKPEIVRSIPPPRLCGDEADGAERLSATIGTIIMDRNPRARSRWKWSGSSAMVSQNRSGMSVNSREA
jgi:hypothetical protein